MNFIVFAKDYPLNEAFGIALFHAVSSFNNAGFDIIGSTSMLKYKDDILLNLTTCFLILGGGLGFLIYEDVFAMKRLRKYSIQTKLVLFINGFLMLFSFLMVKVMEGDSISWLQAFFYSVNLRTAGFSSFDLSSTLNAPTAILSMVCMFIGGSPLSTAGGIKTTTIFVVFLTVISVATGRKPVTYKREISYSTIRRAFVLFFLATFDVFLGTFLVCLFEGNNVSVLEAMFECYSAFGTVGLSMGITTRIGVGSKIVLCLIMYFGRLGPVTMLNLWTPLFKNKGGEIKYLSTELSIG